MIHLTHALPDNNKFFVACSGGVDSMCALHWLSKGDRLPYGIIYVHHNTGQYASDALAFVEEASKEYCFDLFVKRIKGSPPAGDSKEAWWRGQRYNAFQEIIDDVRNDIPIVLAHNLDDCVEQYIMSTLIRIKTNPIINYRGMANTIRPFRTWKKSEIFDYAKRHGVKWIEDPSNTNTKFVRNKVRHELLPMICTMNPGIYGHVKKLIITSKEE